MLSTAFKRTALQGETTQVRIIAMKHILNVEIQILCREGAIM